MAATARSSLFNTYVHRLVKQHRTSREYMPNHQLKVYTLGIYSYNQYLLACFDPSTRKHQLDGGKSNSIVSNNIHQWMDKHRIFLAIAYAYLS